VDAAISGSLKSLGVNHSDPIREPAEKPVPPRREDPAGDGETSLQRHGNQIHLHPTASLAERVLLPGDPGRALALAQFLLERPLMFNHHRGLWGYTGAATDGELLTVQSTGMGGPSAAIVLHELIALGVRRAIRVGTCGALDPSLGLGDLVVARETIAADGTSVALGADALTHADPTLTDALVAQLSPDDGHAGVLRPQLRGRAWHHGRIVSTDLFYESDSARNASWSAEGAIAVEMETSALFTVGTAASIQVACILTVSDTFDGPDTRVRIDDDALLDAAEAMGNAAAAALSA
jgi:DeoD family purine-nucleoside phosphorylase